MRTVIATEPGMHCMSVTKAYGGVPAVGPVTLSVRPGEVLGILGPSGCGKTTLLRMLAGIITPTHGEVVATPELRRRILMFQEGALFPWLTALGNVMLAFEARGIGAADGRPRARALLASLGLGEAMARFPSQLSAGMRQRVAIARALAAAAQVLLMDEPLSALDAQTRLVLQQEFAGLWIREGLTVVYVTHDPEEALMLADRIIVLTSGPGRVIAEFSVPSARPRALHDLHQEEMNGVRREIWRHLPVPAW